MFKKSVNSAFTDYAEYKKKYLLSINIKELKRNLDSYKNYKKLINKELVLNLKLDYTI